MTTLAQQAPSFGQLMLQRYGERVHKIALDAAFTCPNRDGSKGRGGCSFCNNVSFSPNGRQPKPLGEQIAAGREVIRKRTGAQKYLAYFQAYTNTYGDLDRLRGLYDQALAEQGVAMSAREAQTTLCQLAKRYIITKNEPYSFRIGLFSHWILQNQGLRSMT